MSTAAENHPETSKIVFQLVSNSPPAGTFAVPKAANATCMALKAVLKNANTNKMTPKYREK